MVVDDKNIAKLSSHPVQSKQLTSFCVCVSFLFSSPEKRREARRQKTSHGQRFKELAHFLKNSLTSVLPDVDN